MTLARIHQSVYSHFRSTTLLLLLLVLPGGLGAQTPAVPYRAHASAGFVRNAGQVRGDSAEVATVRFVLRLGDVRVYVRDRGFSYVVPVYDTVPEARAMMTANTSATSPMTARRTPRLARMDCDFVGAKAGLIETKGRRAETQTFYFQGKEVADLEVFDTILVRELYPGIDLRFRVVDGQLKYDFLVSPFADVRSICMRFPQATAMASGPTGEMRIAHAFGTVVDDPPVAELVEQDGRVHPREIRFERRDARSFGFTVPTGYDGSQYLVIDPAITWSTFFGGRGEDEVTDAVIGNAGFLVVCGWSLSDVFPGTTTLNQGDEDLFIARFNADRTLNTTTYFGGPKLDIASGVAVDEQDNVFVAGQSMSADLGFAQNVFQWANKNPGIYKDAILIKFTNRLKYVTGTFVGGGDEDIALDVATDLQGNVVIVGNTHSDNYPTTASGFYTTRRGTTGDVDACMTKFTNSLACMWSTYYGGRAAESATACTADSSGNIYVGGWTRSYDFPNLDGFQKARSGDGDGFVMKLTAQGFPLNSTLFGGVGDENINDIDVSRGRVVATGYTSSGNDLPAFGVRQAQDRAGGLSDGFLLCMDRNLGPMWSTYWGGSGPDVFYAVNIASDTSIVIAGYSGSADMPLRRSTQLPHKDGLEDICVAKFTPSGTCMWSTVIGGKGSDVPNAMCLDNLDNMYIVGHSTGADFPVQGAIYPNPQGPKDGVIIKLCPTTPMISLSPNDTVVCAGGTLLLTADPTLSRYQWSTGENTSSIFVKTAGTFFYSADSPLGCRTFSDTVRITIRQKTQAVIQRRGKSTLCDGDSVLLFSVGRFEAYSWRDASGKEIGTKDSVYIKQPGSYHLNIVDKSGCYDSSRTETIAFSVRPSLLYTSRRNGGAVQDTVRSIVAACAGDVVELTAQTQGLPLFWSTGSSTPTIDINTSMRVVASVTDAAGCIWRMDTVMVDFREPQTLTVVGVDTACTGSPVTFRVTERPTASGYLWNTDGGVILSTSDSGTIRVVWSSPGVKRCRVEGRFGGECSDTGVVSLFVRSGLQGGITASARSACAGGTVLLSAPSGYAAYTWNGKLGDTRLFVTGPGRVELEFSDGSGCVGRDTIIITDRSNMVAGASALTFDSVDNNAFLSKSVSVGQRNEDYVLQRVFVTVGSDFSVTSVVPPIGTTTSSATSTSISVLFQPLASGDRRDTLVCVFSAPCRDTLRIPMWGFGKGAPPLRSLRLSLPDTSISVLGSSVTVPLYGIIQSGQAMLRYDSVNCQLEYPADMLRFQAIDQGSAEEVIDRGAGRARLAITLRDVTFRSDTSELGLLTFATLLGMRDRDSVRMLTPVVFPSTQSSMTVQGAWWTWSDVCNEGGARHIGQGNGFVFSVRPNPADEIFDAVIAVVEKGVYTMEVVDVYGRIVHKERVVMPFNGERVLSVDVREHPQGMYVVSVSGPAGHRTSSLLILHGR